ncbi:hypothetical protein B566_EDAN006657 [Ephemera danica]|nr:hypothetical protein B566_EDAN006657 [Ephemera danica]
MSLKVLIVGAGVTSSLIGALLKKFQLPCQVILWDKARGAGGRMSTSRSPSDPTCTADIGAQYITALPHYLQSHNDFYNSLLMSKVLEPLTSRVEGMKDFPEGTCHYVAPNGMSSIAKHFVQDSNCHVKFNHHVSAISQNGDSKWVVQTLSGTEEMFDAVVLTMPVPQILQLQGDVADILGSNKNAAISDGLKTVKYSSRYALGLFFNGVTLPDLGWDAKYLWDHDIFRFPMLISKVKELFPEWPEPAAVKCHKWRYSQVLEPHSGAPGCVVLSNNPLLISNKFVMSNPVVLSFQDTILRESDLQLLQGPHWLNDSLIGFYFEYLQYLAFKDNSDFLFISPEVTQLLKNCSKQELPIFLEPLDAKQKKYIFLPLNDCEIVDRPGGSHWSLLFYSRPEQKMFHLDSAGSNFRQARKLVCNIAFAFAEDGCDYDDYECLQQSNSYDCGIFVLCHAEKIAQHCFEGKDLQTFGMLEPQTVQKKRAELLNLILSLIKNSPTI